MLKGQVGRTENFSTGFGRTEVVGVTGMVSVGLGDKPFPGMGSEASLR